MATGVPTSKNNKMNYQVLYPQYLDSYLTSGEGRKISKNKSVPQPTLEEVVMALQKLGFKNCLIDPIKSLPCLQSASNPNIPYPPPHGCVRVAIKAPASEKYLPKSEWDKATRESYVAGCETKGKTLQKIAEIIRAIPNRKVGPEPTRVKCDKEKKKLKAKGKK